MNIFKNEKINQKHEQLTLKCNFPPFKHYAVIANDQCKSFIGKTMDILMFIMDKQQFMRLYIQTYAFRRYGNAKWWNIRMIRDKHCHNLLEWIAVNGQSAKSICILYWGN